MDPFMWLESYLEDYAVSDNDEYFTEAFGKKAPQKPTVKDKAAAAGKIARDKVAAARKAINEFIDTIIAKIKEAAQAIKLKFAQLSFKRSMSKLGRNAKKQIAGIPYITPELKKLANDTVSQMTKFANAEQSLYLKYMAGGMTSEAYETASSKILTAHESAMALVNQRVDAYLNKADADKDAVVEVSKLLDTVDNTIDAVAAASTKAAEINASILESKKKAKITAKTPDDVVSVSSKSSSKISQIFAKATSILNKILKAAASIGDKALRKAASGASAAKSKASAAIENHKQKKAAKKAATESIASAAADAAAEGKEEEEAQAVEEAYDDVMYTMGGLMSEIFES